MDVDFEAGEVFEFEFVGVVAAGLPDQGRDLGQIDFRFLQRRFDLCPFLHRYEPSFIFIALTGDPFLIVLFSSRHFWQMTDS